MKLLPTHVTINGKRVWLQDATDADVEYIDYRAGLNGVLLKVDNKLPARERIEFDETAKKTS